MTAAPAGLAWSAWFRAQLIDSALCPVCASAQVVDGICRSCTADLRGAAGQEIWDASRAAAAALESRERLLVAALAPAVAGAVSPAPAGLDRRAEGAPQTASAGGAAPAASAPVTPAPVTSAPITPAATSVAARLGGARPDATRSHATVQSMFALAGAGLVAVAAIVFTFFNPDLENRVVRSAIVGLVTVLFLGAAWWLARRGTRLSAEAVGWLGIVFVGIDVWALAQLGAGAAQSWLFAAIATAVAAGVSWFLGSRSGLRCWSSAAVIGVALVPAMLGYSGGTPLAFAIGHLGLVVVAALLLHRLPGAAGAGSTAGAVADTGGGAARTRRGTRIALSALQIAGALTAVPALAIQLSDPDAPYATGLLLLGFSVAAVFSAGQGARVFWSLVAGAAGAAVLPALAIPAFGSGSWQIALLVGGAALGAVLAAVLAPRLRTISRPAFGWAALAVPAVCSAPVVLFLAAQFAPSAPVPGEASGVWTEPLPLVVSGLLLAIGAAVFSRLSVRYAPRAIVSMPEAPDAPSAPTAPIEPSAPSAPSVSALPGAPRAMRPARPTGGLAAMGSLCAVLAVAFAELTVLVALKLALAETGIAGIALESIVVSTGLVAAIVITVVARVPAREWATVLVVSTVPFLFGVLGVVQQRSGWTALTTVAMCVLAVALLVTRREWLGGYLRVIAAALPVPSLAVTAVCLGAEFLEGSASPAVLPAVAALVAIALAGSGILPDLLGRRGPFLRPLRETRLALEVSALVTGGIAVWLSLARAATGLGTAGIVLLLIGLGAALMAAIGRRRYGWWLAAASLTGSLWCVLGLRGAEALEAYVLPPALGAAIVAVVLAARGSRRVDLYSVGLLAAIAPVLGILVLGSDGAEPRSAALLVAAWALLGVGALIARARGTLAALAAPSFFAAMLAGFAGAVRASWLGLAGSPFALCLLVSAIGACAMLLAARGVRRALPRLRSSLWPDVPGAVALAAGCWCAIDRDWGAIWSMWGLMLVYLLAMVIVVIRRRSGRGPAIPVPVLFAVAFATAIVAWSPRELRVEVFSLPLGLLLLLAGAIAMLGAGAGAGAGGAGAGAASAAGVRSGSGSGSGAISGGGGRVPALPPGLRSLADWPLGAGVSAGSWALLGPGVAVTMLASILSTFTDPQTWRAILVMVIALAAMLIGAWLRLAAPFVLGLVVLPVENLFVFAVQIGRGIDSMPWWITLATIGSVLLSVAVFSEQRAGERQTLLARVRDLR